MILEDPIRVQISNKSLCNGIIYTAMGQLHVWQKMELVAWWWGITLSTDTTHTLDSLYMNLDSVSAGVWAYTTSLEIWWCSLEGWLGSLNKIETV